MAALESNSPRRALVLESSDVAEAVARERRQLAAEVHDLVMQDLALALSAARTLLDEPAVAPEARVVVLAGERALSGAREVLSHCSRHGREPVAQAVEAAVRAAARGVAVRFDAERVGSAEQPDMPTLNALVHIGREAVTNASKHADPTAIEVLLAHEEEWLLCVRDDGCGFVSAIDGFGLQSMRQAASALGGTLRVVSAPEAGTNVVAALP